MLKMIAKKIYFFFLRHITFLKPIYETQSTMSPITFSGIFFQKILGINRKAYWPVHRNSLVVGAEYIHIGIGTAPGQSFGNYIFAKEDSPITVGDYTIIAPNVCLAGFNHDVYDYTVYPSKGGISIGNYCWIAMNCSIMPGVKLGDHTIVGANSVVTKSFEEGFCVIGGNPARLIRKLDPQACIEKTNEHGYYGYIKKEKFEAYQQNHLKRYLK